MTSRTEFVTRADGEELYRGDDVEEAIRAWDADSSKTPGKSGGVSVQSWGPYGTMVRDGWILHVFENGQVYLNPRLK